MVPIFAVSISASQGAQAPQVTATLTYVDDEIEKVINLEWDMPHAINAPGLPGEWLYALLSRVVQDYDDHRVVRTVFEPKNIFEGESHVEA